jgi:type II secretory pathway pseudopilin PulG
MSLLEVMVAMAIIVVISLLSWQAVMSSVAIRDALTERDATTRAARVTFSKIRRDLQLAYLTKYPNAIETYETVFVGMDEDPDRLFFASLSHQRLYRDVRECDQTEITIWTEAGPKDGRGYVLYHREAPRVDEEPAEDGSVYPLAYNVRSFRLRYLDSQTNEWVDEWDTRSPDTANRLPRSVQIGLILIGVHPDDPDRTVDIPFLTTVNLEYAPPLQKSLFAKDPAQ